MPADLKLTDLGDIDVTNGTLSLIYDDEAIRQRLRLRLQDVQGDWFRDTAHGTDWFGSILGKQSDATRRAEFRRVILETEGVQALIRFEYSFNRSSRSLDVTFTVQKQDGLELDVQFSDLLAGGQ